ncbi:acyl-CoA dehydrogenase family protein [Mycolicibacter heraklionensis]|uniref:acyl-CoA dehydrogenase family protein n=1 Tax=Mycolicibacter heraklionensis TaxID=512402 RepID=UPI0007EFBFB0|nr:acyl-CoA dehydrogenase family protein [Mycolicibacter heraklionensis]OBJ30049.1 acyl-CoA dehydrogenase [Mycolicibacter heraklionensis]
MAGGVLAAVRPLLPAIAAAAETVDRDGAVASDTVASLRDVGVFALLQPAGFGGRQSDPDNYLAVVTEISAACTSTGWLAAALAVNSWHLALFDSAAQQDVWGGDPGALICSAYTPTGRLERAGDGFRLSGRWSRCAGAEHASWLIAGALVVGADGAAQDFTVALVPREHYTVEPTWNSLGLRGIGAHDVVVSGAPVPVQHCFGWVSDAQRARLAPLYRLPQPTLYTHAGTAPLLGAATGVLDTHRDQMTNPLGVLAMAAAGLEVSTLQIHRNLADLGECARSGAIPDAELMLRARRDQVLTFERAMQAVKRCIEQAGAAADARLDRVWRDVQTARLHAANDVERVLTAVGQFAFGLPVDDLIL